MWNELETLFWLQWKLTRAMFRSHRTSTQFRVLGLLFKLVSFVFTLPLFLAMGIGLAILLILLSPRAAYEVVTVVNFGLFFIWLFLPASYNSQLVERFEMSRLFSHPISFRSIVVGSSLMSLLTMTGIWTVPLLLGQIVGLTYHQPLAFPLILLGALPTFALLVLTGRIMDDLFDLVASDRRLKALMIGLMTLPFMFCWVGQYAGQYATDNFSSLPEFIQIPAVESITQELRQVEEPDNWRELTHSGSQVLEILRPSRLLIWLPPGWAAAGMGLPVQGAWFQGLAFLALAVVFVTGLLWGHASITRRLMEGAALSVGIERVRSGKQSWYQRLPGPPALWAAFRKDWTYLWRSPMPRRLIFSSLVMVVAMALPLRAISQEGDSDIPSLVQEAMPLIAAAFTITMSSMAINMGLTANYFGTIDREGFATLALSPLDRRYALLSNNLTVLLYAGVQYLLTSLAIALLTRTWIVLPLGFYLGLGLQIGGTPAYNLAAIIGPYRTQLKHSGGRQRGNLWGMLAWITSAPPVLALVVLPYVFWKPGLLLTLPLGILYCLALYGLTLGPLARLLQRREHAILESVSSEE